MLVTFYIVLGVHLFLSIIFIPSVRQRKRERIEREKDATYLYLHEGSDEFHAILEFTEFVTSSNIPSLLQVFMVYAKEGHIDLQLESHLKYVH